MLKILTELEITEKIKILSYWTYQNNAIHASFKFNDFKDTFFVMKQIAFVRFSKITICFNFFPRFFSFETIDFQLNLFQLKV